MKRIIYAIAMMVTIQYLYGEVSGRRVYNHQDGYTVIEVTLVNKPDGTVRSEVYQKNGKPVKSKVYYKDNPDYMDFTEEYYDQKGKNIISSTIYYLKDNPTHRVMSETRPVEKEKGKNIWMTRISYENAPDNMIRSEAYTRNKTVNLYTEMYYVNGKGGMEKATQYYDESGKIVKMELNFKNNPDGIFKTIEKYIDYNKYILETSEVFYQDSPDNIIYTKTEFNNLTKLGYDITLMVFKDDPKGRSKIIFHQRNGLDLFKDIYFTESSQSDKRRIIRFYNDEGICYRQETYNKKGEVKVETLDE